MPKLNTNLKYNCARCGQTTDTTLREHYKQVHQDKCSILFKGEYRKITVKRNENGLWVCPRCVEVWSGSCRKMQDHARQGKCKAEIRRLHQKTAAQAVMEENEDTSKTQKIEDEDANMESVEEIIGISEPDLADILTWTCSKSPRTSRGQNGSYSAVTLEAASDDDAVVSMLPQPQLNPPFDLDRPAHSPIEALAVSSQPSKHTSSSSTTAAPVAKPKVTAKKPRFSSPEPPTAETHAKGSQPKFAALPPATKRSTPLDLLATESLQYPSDGPPEVVQGCTPFVRATPTPANPVAVVNEEREVSVASKRASTSLSSSSPSTLVSSTSPAPTATPLFYSSSREMSLLVDALSSDISLPLKAFFSTLHVPLQHLAPIFVQYGFNTVETLDMLCTTPVEGNWDDLKADILAQGRLAGWLAVKKGLEQRAKLLQAS